MPRTPGQRSQKSKRAHSGATATASKRANEPVTLPIDNPEDVESMRLEISVQNSTTRTRLPKGTKVSMIQILAQGMVLDLPERCCSEGHHLVLDIKEYGAKDGATGKPMVIEFISTAKVDSIDATGEGTELVKVTLVQFDERTWKEILATYSNRQIEIERFFSAARGY